MVNKADRVWVRDTAWELLDKDSIKRRCQMLNGNPRQHCPKTGVATLLRSNGRWVYCSVHMYGRRIANGQVQIEVAVDSPAALRGYF